jgi:hypothetical protein
MRRPAAPTKPRVARDKSFPSLVRGWIANEALSDPKPGGAAMLENWFPTATGLQMRGGSQTYATLSVSPQPVRSIFTYLSGIVRQLFAATDDAIFDLTTVLISDNVELVDDNDANYAVDDDLILGFTGVDHQQVVSGQTGGSWVSIQFVTAGGIYLRLVNGQDTPLVYDGTSFSTSPDITGAGLDPADLIFVWEYKRRLFFIEKGTMNAWYLPVESIGGAATKLPLGANFPRGGTLMFGASWSLDSGNGLSEQCAFMSTEGEVVVFRGDNPGDTASWDKVGSYRIGRPLGPRAVVRGGGDLIISSDIGLIPLSQAVAREFAALSPAAVSYPIETEWNERVKTRSAAPWHAEIWPTKQMVLIALPSINGTSPEMLIANARTGAWGLYSGWDGSCLGLYQERLFFGTPDGRVVEAEIGGYDAGPASQPRQPYTAIAVPQFDGLRNPSALKEAGMARAVIRAPSDVIVQISAHADYMIDFPVAPSSAPEAVRSIWGVGVWGQSTWGAKEVKLTTQEWQSVSALGYALTAGVQITSGSVAPPDVELVRIDMTYQVGDL